MFILGARSCREELEEARMHISKSYTLESFYQEKKIKVGENVCLPALNTRECMYIGTLQGTASVCINVQI